MSAPANPRWAALARDTNETKIQMALNIDGGAFPPDTDARLLANQDAHASQSSKSQTIAINTGIGFLDHMLHALAKHAGWSLAINCKGDLHSTSPPASPQHSPNHVLLLLTDSTKSTTTTPPKTSASPSATPSTRPSARSPASPASDTPTPRSTRPSPAPSSISRTAPTASSTWA